MKVLLGMSGGIDSSAAAILLKNMGYSVIGLILRLFDHKMNKYYNASLEKNIQDAKNFSEMIGIKHHVVDVKKEFNETVINYFTFEYLLGHTSFPCIICNEKIKWPVLYQKMKDFNCDFLATGHYVNKIEVDGKYYIIKGEDEDKDQSFFLWPISQQILKKTIFPLGNYMKSEIKIILTEPVDSVAPGQAAAFYRNNKLLGGGFIVEAEN